MRKPYHHKMTSKSPMYIYATEMVSEYYKRINIKNKRVLSIVGSGDQIINAYFFGAKKVIGFDINKYAFFILDLKVSAIKNLTYAEFLRFFGTNMNNGAFNYSMYIKLRNDIAFDTKKFFDKIYNNFNFNGKKIIKSEFFHQRQMIKISTININAYLKNEKSYLKCRNIIKNKNLKFMELDINNISVNKKLKGKFDVINLSNVLNYLTGNTEKDKIPEVLISITRNIGKKIKRNGLFFYYSYSPSTYNRFKSKIPPPASRLELINKIGRLNHYKISYKKFRGVYHNTLDRINIFKI